MASVTGSSSHLTVRSLDRAASTTESRSNDDASGLPDSILGFARIDGAVIYAEDSWTLFRRKTAEAEPDGYPFIQALMLSQPKVTSEVDRLLEEASKKGSSDMPLIVWGEDPHAGSTDRFWAMHDRPLPSRADARPPSGQSDSEQVETGSGPEP